MQYFAEDAEKKNEINPLKYSVENMDNNQVSKEFIMKYNNALKFPFKQFDDDSNNPSDIENPKCSDYEVIFIFIKVNGRIYLFSGEFSKIFCKTFLHYLWHPNKRVFTI